MSVDETAQRFAAAYAEASEQTSYPSKSVERRVRIQKGLPMTPEQAASPGEGER